MLRISGCVKTIYESSKKIMRSVLFFCNVLQIALKGGMINLPRLFYCQFRLPFGKFIMTLCIVVVPRCVCCNGEIDTNVGSRFGCSKFINSVGTRVLRRTVSVHFSPALLLQLLNPTPI